jgi:hypothetical protein
MQTHPIHVIDGHALVLEVRAALFVFPEVLDVFVTGRPDVLVVICSGHPRPAQWLAALRAGGYRIPVRRRGPESRRTSVEALALRT